MIHCPELSWNLLCVRCVICLSNQLLEQQIYYFEWISLCWCFRCICMLCTYENLSAAEKEKKSRARRRHWKLLYILNMLHSRIMRRRIENLKIERKSFHFRILVEFSSNSDDDEQFVGHFTWFNLERQTWDLKIFSVFFLLQHYDVLAQTLFLTHYDENAKNAAHFLRFVDAAECERCNMTRHCHLTLREAYTWAYVNEMRLQCCFRLAVRRVNRRCKGKAEANKLVKKSRNSILVDCTDSHTLYARISRNAID